MSISLPVDALQNEGWYVDLTLQYQSLPDDDEFGFDVLASFAEFSVAGNLNKVKEQISLSLFIEEKSPLECLSVASKLIENDPKTSPAHIVEVELRTEEQRDEELSSPQIPELVSYAEIGEICNVSRQRGRSLALEKEDFPRPLVETKQGPLYDKNAVIAWNSGRTRAPGRPASK